MATQSYFIVLTVHIRDVRNHDRLLPVWGSLRLAPINHHGNACKANVSLLLLSSHVTYLKSICNTALILLNSLMKNSGIPNMCHYIRLLQIRSHLQCNDIVLNTNIVKGHCHQLSIASGADTYTYMQAHTHTHTGISTQKQFNKNGAYQPKTLDTVQGKLWWAQTLAN